MMIRPLLFAYAGLGGALAADGRPWLAAPLCLAALYAIGELWIRALPGRPAETALPAVRAGLSAVSGLITLPLVALLLHLAGFPVRPVPLAVAAAATATLLAAAALLRDRLPTRRAVAPASLPSQRGHEATSTLRASAGHPLSADESVESGGHSPGGNPPTDIAGPASAGAAARAGGHHHEPGYGRTAAIVGVPVLLAVAVGAAAVRGYLKAPHPAEPGYLSVALSGWAAAINRPVTVPSRGLSVPVRVTSAGLADTTTRLRLWVGGQIVASEPLTVAADTVRLLTVRIPGLPPDGCLHAIDISVGTTSTGFYARGRPALARSASCRGGAPAHSTFTDRDAPTTAGGATRSGSVSGTTRGGAVSGPAHDDAAHDGDRSGAAHGGHGHSNSAPAADRTGDHPRSHAGGAAAPGGHRAGTRDGAAHVRPNAGGHRDGAGHQGADGDGGDRPGAGAAAVGPDPAQPGATAGAGGEQPGAGAAGVAPDRERPVVRDGAAPADATAGNPAIGVIRPGVGGRFTDPGPAGVPTGASSFGPAPVLEKFGGPATGRKVTSECDAC
ncbi:hypothetical protein [Actinoplanes flavus]|uniref:Uncharacterized protein n=1 Tax=Actinoplanes flavus TaxID=2820290 RepID=A0ABS3UVZ9_9ACTN|nr:hypothetical protein [Actinoplanes flavus]MBO3742764.1 hypothetical protein [Actinoplanes flavus]